MTNTVAIITAYCACKLCCGPDAVGLTASGVRPVQGVTVAAPRSVPFGTLVNIDGVGLRTVQDRMARRYDGRWDVYFERHEDAKQFGIRKAVVTQAFRPAPQLRLRIGDTRSAPAEMVHAAGLVNHFTTETREGLK